jgi:hypothetical protein
MQIAAAIAPTTSAPTTPTTGPVAAASHSDRNPWGFPALDAGVARRAVAGLEATSVAINRLIDRSIAVRTMLDRDLKSGRYTPDTVRSVLLLTRARDYARGTIETRHLAADVRQPVIKWIRDGSDTRIDMVATTMYDAISAVTNLLDDDEGNVREEIAEMRAAPSRRVWQSIRDGVDGAIASLYAARDISGATHVLRAAGELA